MSAKESPSSSSSSSAAAATTTTTEKVNLVARRRATQAKGKKIFPLPRPFTSGLLPEGATPVGVPTRVKVIRTIIIQVWLSIQAILLVSDKLALKPTIIPSEKTETYT